MSDSNRHTDRQHRPTNVPSRSTGTLAEDDSVSRTVIETVAALEDSDPTELPVLANVVDPDALDDLFGPRFDGDRREVEGRIEFDYGGYRVTVGADETFTVRPVADDGEDSPNDIGGE